MAESKSAPAPEPVIVVSDKEPTITTGGSVREIQAKAGAGWRSYVPPLPASAPPAEQCSSVHWNAAARKFICKAKPQFAKTFYARYGNNKVAIDAD